MDIVLKEKGFYMIQIKDAITHLQITIPKFYHVVRKPISLTIKKHNVEISIIRV